MCALRPLRSLCASGALCSVSAGRPLGAIRTGDALNPLRALGSVGPRWSLWPFGALRSGGAIRASGTLDALWPLRAICARRSWLTLWTLRPALDRVDVEPSGPFARFEARKEFHQQFPATLSVPEKSVKSSTPNAVAL